MQHIGGYIAYGKASSEQKREGATMNGWDLLKWGSLAVGGAVGAGILARGAYRAGVKVYDDVYERWRRHRHDKLTLEHIADQNDLRRVREIKPDERGRFPLLLGLGGILRDPNTLRAFTLETVRETWPGLEKLDAVIRAVVGAGGWPTPATAQAMIPETAIASAAVWRSVTLGELVRSYGKPGYHRLLLGETLDQATGDRRPVTGDMGDFVHVILTGSTGWGKSTALEAMAKQLVIGGDCDLAFVDYGVNTFGMLADHGLYPIADTPTAAVALFKALVQEMHKRREAMAEYPQVKKLDQYNDLTGAGLRPLVVFVDEASSLLDKSSDARDMVRDLTAMGRKYGLGCVFGGTDFKVDTMPSETRGNCGLRMAMHLEEPGLSRSIIRSTNAVNLTDKGRALACLPGVAGLVELQCPIVETWADLPPRQEQIALATATAETAAAGDGDQVTRVLEMHEAGASLNAIQRELFGYVGGSAYETVKAILGDTTTTTAGDTGNTDDLAQEVEGSSIELWCDFCGRNPEMAAGAEFGTCASCGVAVCDDCAVDGRCPDCAERGQ